MFICVCVYIYTELVVDSEKKNILKLIEIGRSLSVSQ